MLAGNAGEIAAILGEIERQKPEDYRRLFGMATAKAGYRRRADVPDAALLTEPSRLKDFFPRAFDMQGKTVSAALYEVHNQLDIAAERALATAAIAQTMAETGGEQGEKLDVIIKVMERALVLKAQSHQDGIWQKN